MGVDIPDSARIVLFQEDKFKNYYNELHWALSEYDKVVGKVIPVTAMVLRPHFRYDILILMFIIVLYCSVIIVCKVSIRFTY